MKKMWFALVLILLLVGLAHGYDVPVAADNSSNNIQKVPVLGAKASTAAPTWTSGNQVPLSVDTGGSLRIIGNVGGLQSDNSANSPLKIPTLPAKANSGTETWTSGNEVPLSVDTSGQLRVTGSISGRSLTVSNIGTALTTNSCVQMVAASGSTAVKVYTINYTMAASTVQVGQLYFTYGTGTNCATGQTTLTAGFTDQNLTGPVQFSGGSIPLFVTPASQALCACVTGSNTLTGRINLSYIQE